MRKHILSDVGQVVEAEEMQSFYYDFESQISYIDKEFKRKVVNLYFQEKSLETRVIENSDPDEFVAKRGTVITETTESSDVDEFNVLKTKDRNEKLDTGFIKGFILKSKKTLQTNTIENSDCDEFTLS